MATRFAFVDDSGETRLAGFLEPEPGGSMTLVDLGVLDAADLIDGPQTIHTPTEGEYVQIQPGPADFAAMPSDTPGVYILPQEQITLPDVVALPDLTWTFLATDYWKIPSFPGGTGIQTFVRSGSPIVAIAYTDNDAILIDDPVGTWSAAHGFGSLALILAAGFIWSANDGGGTSGASEPDFAGTPGLGDTVADNDITWTNQGLTPEGTVHLYALVAAAA